MNLEISDQVGAVVREVTTREVEGRPAKVVKASRSYGTAIEDVWDAVTNVERIPRWFTPVSGDLRLGGRYQLQGNASGEVTQCDPPRSFAITWEYGGEVSWVEVRLQEEEDGGTRLELEHIAHVDDARWEQFGPGAVGVGWDLGLVGLHMHLSTGAAAEPGAGEAWMGSDDGKKFMRRSSADWGDASIAAGTDESLAKASASRTTAFYLGESEEGGSGDATAS